MEKAEIVNRMRLGESEVTTGSAVVDVDISSRNDGTIARLPTPQQTSDVHFILDDEQRSGHAAETAISVMQPATVTVLPQAVASICHNHATKVPIPTAHATEILPPIAAQRQQSQPRPSPSSWSMNAAIDRTVALSQQRREALIAEGTVVVEDYSSIRIDLDRVDAFYQNLERRDFVRRFAFKYFRMGIYFMGMALAWIIATPLFFKACASLGLHNLHFTPAFPLALLPYLLILMCGMQPLGAMLMYWTHLLGEEMLPRRNGRGTLTQVLLSGACCFCDNVLSSEQFWRLLAVQVVNVAGFYLCGAASIMAVFGLVPNILDDDAVGTFLFLWALLSLPAWGWFRLIQYIHKYILLRRRSSSNSSYSIVATADAVVYRPAMATADGNALELV